MGLGSFRKRAKNQEEELIKQHEYQNETKDDKGFTSGSIFIPEKIPDGMEEFRPVASEKGNSYIIDIVPFYAGCQHPHKPEGRLAYVVDLWVHRYIGPGNDMLVCQMKTGGWREPDNICTYIKNNQLSKDEWKRLNSKRRCCYFVWDHTTPEEEEKGLKYWEVAHFLFEKNVDDISKNPRGGGAIAWSHHDYGKSIAFTVTISGSYTDAEGNKYDSQDWTGFQFLDRLEPAIPDEILDQTFPLDEAINMHPTQEEWDRAFPDGKKSESPIEISSGDDGRFGRGRIRSVKEEEVTKKEPSEEEPKCPIEGMTFGVDTGNAKECRSCEFYDPCFDAKSTSSPKEEEKPKLSLKPKEEPELPKAEDKPKPKLQRRRRNK